MSKSNFIDKLKERWKLENSFQVLVVLLIFALTGFTVIFVKKPIMNLLGVSIGGSLLFNILYYILILPIYQLLLLFYALILGKFNFFWEYEKKFFSRIAKLFGK